jgi:hypothetical protein
MGGGGMDGPCEFLGLDVEVGLDALCELGLGCRAVIGGGGGARFAAGLGLAVGGGSSRSDEGSGFVGVVVGLSGWQRSCQSCSDHAEDGERLHSCGGGWVADRW